MDTTASPPLPSIPPCRFTRWPQLYEVNGEAIETTWEAFFDELSVPTEYQGQTKHPGWSAAVLEPTVRADENVVGMTAVVLDYDKSTTVEDALVHWREWYGFLHTSRRHTPEAQRFRVILPLARIVTPDEYEIIWAWARELAVTAGQEVDESTKNPSRFWYLPGAKAIGHYRAERLGGVVVLDPNPILASHTEAVRFADEAEVSASAPMPAGSSTSGRVKWIERMLDAQIDAVSNAGRGHRNVTLNKCAYRVGQFVAGGDLSDAKARAALRSAALKAGLPEREIRGTLKSAFVAATKSPRYVPRARPPLRLVGPSTTPPPDDDWQPPQDDGSSDDTGLAAPDLTAPSFAFERGDHAELCEASRVQIESQETPITYEDGDFWRYCPQGGYWKRFLTESVEHVARGFAGSLICPPGGKPKVLNITSGACSGAARLLRNELVSRADRPSFAHAPRGVAFRNGFVTIDETPEHAGEIRVLPHSPDNRARVGLPFSYDPESAHPKLDAFLEELFHDAAEEDRACRIALLQEFLGACLMGLAPSLQRCLMVFGPGGNGKSELVKIARSIFPEEAQCSLSPQKWEERFALSMLVGKLANFCDEMPDKEMIGSEIFKGVITGNEQQTEFKGRDGFIMRPRAGHIFSANMLPATGDHSAGFYRRFVVLMLTRNFEERDSEARRLDAASDVTASERAQIAAWAVTGAAHAFRQKGYTIPSSSAETRSAWMIESDSVALWVRDCTMETKSESGLFSGEMYPAYQAWATRSGLRACSLVSFGRRLIARTPHRILNGKNYYLVRVKA